MAQQRSVSDAWKWGTSRLMCPRSEGTLKMRCFKCNSEEHLKAQCPLLKTHVSKDKDKKRTTSLAVVKCLLMEDDVLEVVSELDHLVRKFVFSSSNLQHWEAKEDVCPSLQPV